MGQGIFAWTLERDTGERPPTFGGLSPHGQL